MAVTASSPLLGAMVVTEAVVVAVAVAAVLGGNIGVDVVVVVAAVVGIVARLAGAVVVMEHVPDTKKRLHPTWGMREAAIVGSRLGVGTSHAP
jgi:hypothetical protein